MDNWDKVYDEAQGAARLADGLFGLGSTGAARLSLCLRLLNSNNRGTCDPGCRESRNPA
jgi:hypothetical protein